MKNSGKSSNNNSIKIESKKNIDHEEIIIRVLIVVPVWRAVLYAIATDFKCFIITLLFYYIFQLAEKMLKMNLVFFFLVISTFPFGSVFPAIFIILYDFFPSSPVYFSSSLLFTTQCTLCCLVRLFFFGTFLFLYRCWLN